MRNCWSNLFFEDLKISSKIKNYVFSATFLPCKSSRSDKTSKASAPSQYNGTSPNSGTRSRPLDSYRMVPEKKILSCPKHRGVVFAWSDMLPKITDLRPLRLAFRFESCAMQFGGSRVDSSSNVAVRKGSFVVGLGPDSMISITTRLQEKVNCLFRFS